MFASIRSAGVFTLVGHFSVLIALFGIVQANELSLRQRDHSNLKRLIKKRFPSPQGLAPDIPVPVAAAGNDPPTFSSISISTSAVTSSSSTTASSSSTTSSSVVQTSATSTSSSSSATSSSSSVSSSLSSSSSSSSVSSSSSSVSSSSSSSSSSPVSQPTEAVDPIPNSPTAIVSTVRPTVTQTQSVEASSSAVPQTTSGSSKTKTVTLTAVIVIASVIGAVVILWTIFRKWKLGRSKKFDARLQPIDWQPTNPEEDIIPSHRRNPSGASSFHSGGHENSTGRGAYDHMDYGNGSSDHGHGTTSLNPVPDHDFTANASMAPVGGYADLARGPSPQPQMQQTLMRGPSMNRGYDVGVPLHHQAGYGVGDPYNYNNGRY